MPRFSNGKWYLLDGEEVWLSGASFEVKDGKVPVEIGIYLPSSGMVTSPTPSKWPTSLKGLLPDRDTRRGGVHANARRGGRGGANA
jgi:hypothetical protein